MLNNSTFLFSCQGCSALMLVLRATYTKILIQVGRNYFLIHKTSQLNIFISQTFHVGYAEWVTRESAYLQTKYPLGVSTILMVWCTNFSSSLSRDMWYDAFCFLYSNKVNIQCFLYPSLSLYVLYHFSPPNRDAHKQSLNLANTLYIRQP